MSVGSTPLLKGSLVIYLQETYLKKRMAVIHQANADLSIFFLNYPREKWFTARF